MRGVLPCSLCVISYRLCAGIARSLLVHAIFRGMPLPHLSLPLDVGVIKLCEACPLIWRDGLGMRVVLALACIRASWSHQFFTKLLNTIPLICTSYYYNSNPAPTSLFLIPSFTSGCVAALGMLCLVTNRNKYIGILMAPRTGLFLSTGGLAAGQNCSIVTIASYYSCTPLRSLCLRTEFLSWSRGGVVSLGVWASAQRVLECNSIRRLLRHGVGLLRARTATP